MKQEELYPYTKEELIEKMKRLAAAYTPEWKFDAQYPDVGTALAMIYADMFYDTVHRYNRIQEKNRAAFFDSLGTRLKPSVPAQGYMSFSLSSDEFGGVAVPGGFLVMTEGQGADSESVSFETQDSVYVLPSKLETMFLVDGENDRIQRIYTQKEEKTQQQPFYLFQSSEENLQEHMFCLSQNEVLHLKGPAEICIRMTLLRFMENKDAYLEMFLDEAETVFEYSTSQGFVPFERRRKEENCLILTLDSGQPKPEKMELYGREDYWIRCRYLKPYTAEPLVIEDIRLTSRGENLLPDVVQTEAGEEGVANIFPFGERPMPYHEVYIAADQILSKSGARVAMSFSLDYERIPLENSGEPERDWKLVMKRSDFKPDPEYDITVERVIWEYYNGTGWSRLFDGTENSHIFNGGDGTMGQKFTIEFTCPEDARPFLYNSTESRYLRIRILKMNNLFKVKGNYITPVMSDILFSFDYKGQGKVPDFLETVNNMQRQELPVRTLEHGTVKWTVFTGLGHKEKTLYLKFTQPLFDGPVRILFSMEETFREEMAPLRYEYFSKDGFLSLPVMDQTEHMRKSGTITFMGRPDFAPTRFWQEDGCWIRITRENWKGKRTSLKKQEPVVNGIFMNAARILAVQTMPPETFGIEPKEEDKVCRLLNQNVHHLEVWVNELETVTESQRKRLEEEFSVQEEKDSEGRLTGFWVKWEEKEDFYLSSPEDRHYVADRMQGEVRFSNGRNGAIPTAGATDTIRIVYSCGGGVSGNQREGTITQMSRTLGYINQAVNPRITTGGSDQETVDEAIRRMAAALRHRGRAVTVRDYEALALEASREVMKVKCFPNCNEKGIREPGSVTLVVLQKNFKDGRIYFDQVKSEGERYIVPRLEGNQAALGRFYVAEPRYLKLECRLELVVSDFNDVFDVKNRVTERIEDFLDPITGNFNRQGWEIGRVPNEVQIANAVKGIPGIRYMKELRLSAFIQSREGWIEVDRDSSDLRRFAVALGGSHQIFITVEN